MKFIRLFVCALFFMSLSCVSNAAEVKSLFNESLPELPKNQEVVMITVEYKPGESTPPHRHNAHTYLYVLEGSVGMQVKGSEHVTLVPGDTFYELPDDIHIVSKNMSETETAKFLVLMIKTKGKPIMEFLK